MRKANKKINDARDKATDERELNQIEIEALDRFKKNDQEIDDILSKIVDNLDLLKNKAENIDRGIQRNQELEEKLHDHAEQVGAKMESANARLKKLVEQYAKPTNFCMYMVLILILLGLIMILYNQIKSKL